MNELTARKFERLYTLMEFNIDCIMDHRELMTYLNDKYTHYSYIERFCKKVETDKLDIDDVEALESFVEYDLERRLCFK